MSTEEPAENPLMDVDDQEDDQVNLANALDLSESEEEELTEDLVLDFAQQGVEGDELVSHASFKQTHIRSTQS